MKRQNTPPAGPPPAKPTPPRTISKPKTLEIEMIQEAAMDNKGKQAKDPEGKKVFRRDDFVGLLNLLNRFDSRLHGMEDYKDFIKIKDTLFAHWANNKKKIHLTLDEAVFLKNYLAELTEKDAKDTRLAEHEMRSLVGILEQLGE